MRHAVTARPIQRASLICTAVRAWRLLALSCLCTGIWLSALGLSAQPARADTSGCTVVLCVANPAGWAAVDECVSPVAANFRSIRRQFRPPMCVKSGASF